MPVALPASLPAPAYDGNVQEEADIAETCEFESGEARRSPIYRSVPNIVRWSWMLTQAEFDDYADWFEDDLQAGALSFSLPVVEQGGSFATTTTEALFSAPPTETQIAPDVWRVDAVAVTGVGIINPEEPTPGAGYWELSDPAIDDLTAETWPALCEMYAGALTAASGGESTWTNLGPSNGQCFAVAAPSGTIRAAPVVFVGA